MGWFQENREGETPLLLAAQEGHKAVLHTLLQHKGIDVNKARFNGENPLFVASQNGHTEVN